ncbi:MAG: thiamine phosphate synthase [Methylococcales symbiont of Hymedesmia sp. n. MRB-2018]|nr:MAG: thiamine phosphate synthase [Methylococcales symbiont of Hymedesmia sp. n. MRB-2018]
MKFPTSGLYAITQTEGKKLATIVQEVAAAIKGGAGVIQYRDKTATTIDRLNCATALQTLCHTYAIPLLINDDVELALKVKADGVHLGKNDGSIAASRKRLGNKAIIGLSCYNDINLAKKAEFEGANYVAFGRFFPSASKPLALPAQQETLRLAKKMIQVPIVAIGGILPNNGQQLLDNGADVLAVIGGIFDHAAEQSALNYQTLFSR